MLGALDLPQILGFPDFWKPGFGPSIFPGDSCKLLQGCRKHCRNLGFKLQKYGIIRHNVDGDKRGFAPEGI